MSISPSLRRKFLSSRLFSPRSDKPNPCLAVDRQSLRARPRQSQNKRRLLSQIRPSQSQRLKRKLLHSRSSRLPPLLPSVAKLCHLNQPAASNRLRPDPPSLCSRYRRTINSPASPRAVTKTKRRAHTTSITRTQRKTLRLLSGALKMSQPNLVRKKKFAYSSNAPNSSGSVTSSGKNAALAMPNS